VKADCFLIRCRVIVILETRDESVRLPSPDLHRHVGNMLATGVGGHVTFQVGKEAFVAHKNVLLVRSPVFMAKFFGGVME
jgi:speckle-type POZ protein